MCWATSGHFAERATRHHWYEGGHRRVPVAEVRRGEAPEVRALGGFPPSFFFIVISLEWHCQRKALAMPYSRHRSGSRRVAPCYHVQDQGIVHEARAGGCEPCSIPFSNACSFFPIISTIIPIAITTESLGPRWGRILKFQHEATTHSGAGEKATHNINVVGTIKSESNLLKSYQNHTTSRHLKSNQLDPTHPK